MIEGMRETGGWMNGEFKVRYGDIDIQEKRGRIQVQCKISDNNNQCKTEVSGKKREFERKKDDSKI